MKVDLVQMELRDNNIEYNTSQVIANIVRTDVAGGTELVVFPEATLSGFPTAATAAAVAQPIDGPAVTAVREAARRAGVSVVVGFAERDAAQFFNTSLLIDETGEILLRYRKTHLWASDVGVFTAGDRFETRRWHGIEVGLLICYDIEFPETARAVASLGAELLIVTDGNMDPFGPVHRRAIVARAMENQIFAVLTNRCGAGADSMTFPGESVLVDPFGEVVATAGAEAARLSARIDLDRLSASRARYRYLDDARVALDLAKIDAAGSRPALVIPEPRRRAG